MAVTGGQFTVKFDKVNDVFILEDTTDYAGQSKPLTDIYGNFKIVSPAAITIHNNTSSVSPDIDADVSLINNAIALPTDSNGDVLLGNYVFTYTITDTSDSSTLVVVSNVNFCYESPEIDLRISYNCAKPELTSKDYTNYLVDGVMPTTVTYDHYLFYPPTTGASTINASANIITTNVFYTLKNVGLQHSSELIVDLVYTYPTYGVIDQISGREYDNVICDPNLCDIFCGLYTLWNNYLQNKGGCKQDEYLEKFVRLSSASQLVRQAYDCGQSDKIPAIIAEIKAQGNFADECCCGDDSEVPVLVTGVGGSFNTVLQQGTGIVVTSSVAGSITTYVVALDPSVLAAVNNIRTEVVSSGLSTNVTSATVGTTTTYTVNVTYAVSDNTVPYYDATSQRLQNTPITWDNIVLKSTLNNSQELNLQWDTNYKIRQFIDAIDHAEALTGSMMKHTSGSKHYYVENGDFVSSSLKGSGFSIQDSGEKAHLRLVDDGAIKYISKFVSDGLGNQYTSVEYELSSLTSITDGSTTSSFRMDANDIRITSPLTRITNTGATAGNDFFTVDEFITAKKEASGTAFSIGKNTVVGSYTNVIIGDSAVASGNEAIAIGASASTSTHVNSIGIGGAASVTGIDAIALGADTSAAVNSTSVGYNARSTVDGGIVIGNRSRNFFTENSVIVGNYIESQGSSTGINITLGAGDNVGSLLTNSNPKSLLVGFSTANADKLMDIGRSQSQNYIGGSGTFEFSSTHSLLAQNSKWNFHDGDIEVVNLGSGIIIKSPDGTRYRLTIQNAGTGVTITAA